MLKLFKNHRFITGLAICIFVAFSIYAFLSLYKTSDYSYEVVSKRNLQSGISASGQVKPVKGVDLGFERSGKVAHVYVSVGDKVKRGQVIAELTTDDLTADRDQAKAALAAVRAQASVQQTQALNSNLSTTEAEKNLADKILASYTTADDIIRTQIGQLFVNPNSNNPKLNFDVSNSQLVINIENQRVVLNDVLNKLNNVANNISTSSQVISADILARSTLLEIKDFVAYLAEALNNSTASPSVSVTQLATWKTMIANNRAAINTAVANLTAAEEKYTNAKSASNVSNQIISNGSNTSVTDAQIAQAQAVLEKAESQLSKAYLTAPFSGVITRLDVKEGEIIAANMPLAISSPLVSMISNDNFQVDFFVSEIQVVKIKTGDMATTTLDAFGTNSPFLAKVVSVDPAETLQNGVPSYKVSVQFVDSDIRIKSGMNANISISIIKKDNVLAVPTSAIIKNGSDNFIMLKNDNRKETVMTKVETGIVDNDGYVEILSGLNDGQKVAVFNK